ncbi:HD domain-containing protein [Konateibacter massiliensis]|uniref:HD domain-containing protein n=1 Tax=Konateibacter massiliensis TaxID=2002841 RepID=UPI000C1491DB|nr:HD domain-containing protein [Konateibacter massiliensis]
MLIEKENVRKTFQEYVKNYNDEDPRIKLKIDHTYRVAALCKRIAVSLEMSEEEIELAWLIGMLHDIGRFEQLKNYGTFMDAKSINHAQYGVKLLFEDGLIRRFIEDERYDTIIRKAIWYHNAYLLPQDFDERTMLFCNLIRDADKIDILKVNVEIPLETVYDFSEEEIRNSVVTADVMDGYMSHRAVEHKLKKSPLDYVVGHISLVFELVYPISLKIAEEQGYLRQLLHFKVENEIAKQQFEKLEKEMTEYIRFAG